MIWSGSLFSKTIVIGSGSLYSKTIVIASGSILRGPLVSLVFVRENGDQPEIKSFLEEVSKVFIKNT